MQVSSGQVSTEKDVSATNAFNGVVPVTLAWHNIRVTREKPSTMVILDNINGKALPNEIVALMGASGAGKTTLLNSLMSRNLNGLTVEGEILVGGSADVKIVDVSGYVQQEEIFIPTLTCYEHLMIQAGIRLAGLPQKEIKEKIVEIMEQLGLIKCRDSVIGLSGVKKGISGGEVKRLMVASVLLDNPSILFLDEPTTGLDSHMAQSLMESLQKLAKDGRTIVCTIHQPSTKVFNSLDKVIFLGDGKLAYLGPTTTVLPFFDSIGLVCPEDFNPADYIIDMLAIDKTSGNEKAALARVNKVVKGYTESALTKDACEDLKNFNGYGAEEGFVNTRRRASWFAQVRLILKRSLIDNKRNAALSRAKFVQKFIIGLFIGLLYLGQADIMEDSGIVNINGALFFIVTELTLSTLFGIITFMPNDFPLIVREHFDGLYRVSAYYVARVLSYLPIFVLDGVLLICISYYLVGFAPQFQYFIINIGICILIEQSAAAFGVMLSTCSPSYAIALSIAGPVLTFFSLTGGLFANVGKLPYFISWIQYLSWFKYGYEALIVNQWRGAESSLENGKHMGGNDGHNHSAKNILDRFSFREEDFWIDIIALIGLIACFYIIGYIGLYIRVHRNR